MLKRNLFYNSLLSVSQIIFPLITFPYSSRILGPEGIGAVSFIDSITQYFILFAALGIPLYGVKEISKHKTNPEDLNKVFNEIFLVHIRSAAIFCGIYFLLGLTVPALNAHMDLICIGIVILVFSVLSAEWLFLGLEQFSYITVRTIIIKFLSVILLFIFLRKDSPPVIYYAIMAASYVSIGVLNLYSLRKHVKFKFRDLELRKHVKPLIIILSSTLAASVYLLLDTVILGFLKGAPAVGIYSTASRIVRLPLAVILSIGVVIAPQVSIAYSNADQDGIRKLIDKSFSFMCVVALPFVAGIYISAPFLVDTLAGPKFHSSIIVLQILTPLLLLNAIGNIFCLQLLGPMGKEKYLLKAMLIGMCTSLLISILLIHWFSFRGAAISYMITEVAATLAAWYYVRKVIDLKLNMNIFFQCLLGSLFFLPIAYFFRQLPYNYFLVEILIILVSMLFYGLYVWFFIKNLYIENLKNIIRFKLNLL